MNFADVAKRVGKLAINHSPAILTSIGVAGAITTAVLAAKASFEAADIIARKEKIDERNGVVQPEPRELLKERAKLVWKLYIPAAGMCGATIACIIGAQQVGARRAAGVVAAYSILEKSFDEYKDKVVEKIGPRKEEAIHDAIMQDRVNDTFMDGITIHGKNTGELCYDKFSDRYFLGTVEELRRAENDLNYQLIHDGYATLDDFYQYIGLPSTGYSYQIGWNSDRKLELGISTALAHGEKPCISMYFKTDPAPEYGRFH